MHTSFSTHVARIALTCGLLYSGVLYAISCAQALIAPPRRIWAPQPIKLIIPKTNRHTCAVWEITPHSFLKNQRTTLKKRAKTTKVVYQRQEDLEIKNPFPNVISDEEIAAAFKHDDSIQKYFFTADSDHTQTPKLIENNILKDEAGTYTIYTVVKKYSTTGLFNKLYAQGYQTRNGLVLKDGSNTQAHKQLLPMLRIPIYLNLMV